MTEMKEGFCGACVAGIAALAGAGVNSSTMSGRKKNKKLKKLIFWISFFIVLLSIFFTIYYLWIKDCGECA